VRVIAPVPDAHQRPVGATGEPLRGWTGRRKLNRQEAAEVWNDLMRGSWVLVDRDESGAEDVLVAIPAPPANRPARLTPDEVLVIAMALAGRANKYIAFELGVAQSTVSARLNRAMAKLEVENRAQLQRRYGASAALESSAA
jgi:DNA-binding NarL/FixJ family response regulator